LLHHYIILFLARPVGKVKFIAPARALQQGVTANQALLLLNEWIDAIPYNSTTLVGQATPLLLLLSGRPFGGHFAGECFGEPPIN
jgi:hypothetical protein